MSYLFFELDLSKNYWFDNNIQLKTVRCVIIKKIYDRL